MRSAAAELLKLTRSTSWAVVVALPSMAVLSGTVSTVAGGQQLDNGWHTLWLRVVVFYGLFPLTVGLAALCSLVWRSEHSGGNWNALMSRSTSSRSIVTGKVAVLVALSAAMQTVLVVGVVLVGKAVFGLAGVLPARYLLISVVIVLASIPVLALQSLLSMIVRSFSPPIGVGLLGAVGSALLLLGKADLLIAVVPYALLARATQLGTGTFADDGDPTVAVVLLLLVASVALTALLMATTTRRLDRRDIR